MHSKLLSLSNDSREFLHICNASNILIWNAFILTCLTIVSRVRWTAVALIWSITQCNTRSTILTRLMFANTWARNQPKHNKNYYCKFFSGKLQGIYHTTKFLYSVGMPKMQSLFIWSLLALSKQAVPIYETRNTGLVGKTKSYWGSNRKNSKSWWSRIASVTSGSSSRYVTRRSNKSGFTRIQLYFQTAYIV